MKKLRWIRLLSDAYSDSNRVCGGEMKTILSTCGKKILVDAEDYEWASQLSWNIIAGGAVYNGREWGEKEGPQYVMSRVIMGLNFGDPVWWII